MHKAFWLPMAFPCPVGMFSLLQRSKKASALHSVFPRPSSGHTFVQLPYDGGRDHKRQSFIQMAEAGQFIGIGAS
ncbi:MAG: hypothetical protein MK172_08495 [Verrucomicrobiales bacterium]|nr:hypothetical protein [Verrucomicrobiales bacterium]